jgi:hypothetical protein
VKPNRESIRRFIAGALCDLVGYLDELSDPIVVGGRYSKDRLIQAFYSWCQERNINVKDADAIGWLNACRSGSLTTDDGPTRPPEQPKPPPAPFPPPTATEPEENLPEEGFYRGDSWKPPEERKKPWYTQGEDWKDDDNESTTA